MHACRSTLEDPTRVPVAVDAERYRERRREALEALTRRVAGRVRRNGRPAALDPMPASERRFIHTLLADDPQLTTYSEGEGIDRHIVIAPRGGAAESAGGRGPAPRPSRRAPVRTTPAGQPSEPAADDDGLDMDEDAAKDTVR